VYQPFLFGDKFWLMLGEFLYRRLFHCRGMHTLVDFEEGGTPYLGEL